MLQPAATYREVYDSFVWRIPERYNIAIDVVDRHADATPDATALIYETPDGRITTYSFLEMKRLSNRCANLLAGHGIRPGDRFAILLGQTPETALTHVGCWKLGAISIPMFTLFGEEALEFRLSNSGAKGSLTDRENYPKIAAIRDRLPDLKTVFLADGTEIGALDFWREMEVASDAFRPRDSRPDDPAFLSYTSGTTGSPKGALHAHRTMLGHMPGFDIAHGFYGFDGDLHWSPADWAWIAGLMDVLMPTWWHGKPVLAFRSQGRFDPEQAFHMIGKHQVRNSLLVPTMLKLMRQVPNPPKVDMRSIVSGGEAVGVEILEWGRRQFGFDIAEGFGQTECNLVLSHVPTLMPPKTGSLGQPSPGHVGAIVDDDGNVLPAGETGNIAFKRPNPVMMLHYWNNPEATAQKYAGDWLITGDHGTCDEDGYFWFVGRADDVITSSGYRIGPGEIEDCLLKHPAVVLAAVIGVPDPERTEAIKAFIVLAEGQQGAQALEDELRAFVRGRLAKHEYPRQIEFVTDLPTTATGKVMRRVLRQREMEKLL